MSCPQESLHCCCFWPKLACLFPVSGHSAAEALLMELPADGLAAHRGPGQRLKLGSESFDGGLATLPRYFLHHLAVLIPQLVRSAAPRQGRGDSTAFPAQYDSAHCGLIGHVQQRRDLPDRLLALVTSHDGSTLKATEFTTSAHYESDVLTFFFFSFF